MTKASRQHSLKREVKVPGCGDVTNEKSLGFMNLARKQYFRNKRLIITNILFFVADSAKVKKTEKVRSQ